MLCIFLCFVFCFVFFHLQLILAITKDVNTKTYNTRRFIVKSQFNRSIPLSCKWIKVKRKKKSIVMCNACYIYFFYVCTLSHVHADPYSEVPCDINRKPCASCCLQRDGCIPLVFSRLHMNDYSFVCECAFTYGIRFRFSKLLM